MSRSRLLTVVPLLLLPLLAGCGDQVALEEAAIPLAAGLDLDENNHLRFYISNPVFGEQTNKVQQYNIPVTSLRDSRNLQDAYTSGALEGRNYQVYVVGRKLLQYEDWYKTLDVVYRDARNTVLDRMVYFDGPLEEMFKAKVENQPMLALLLRGMVDSKSKRGNTVRTTIQDMHRQVHEEAITPSLSEVTYDTAQRNFRLKGTALLNHKGQYVASLGFQESALLNLLKKQAGRGVSLSFAMPERQNAEPFALNRVSYSIRKLKVKIKTDYNGDRFRFRVSMKISAALTERLFEFNMPKNYPELEKKLEAQLTVQLEELIKKFQTNKIDPIGFGIFARAYQYPHYKKAENRWGEEFSSAYVDFDVKIRITSMGPVT